MIFAVLVATLAGIGATGAAFETPKLATEATAAIAIANKYRAMFFLPCAQQCLSQKMYKRCGA